MAQPVIDLGNYIDFLTEHLLQKFYQKMSLEEHMINIIKSLIKRNLFRLSSFFERRIILIEEPTRQPVDITVPSRIDSSQRLFWPFKYPKSSLPNIFQRLIPEHCVKIPNNDYIDVISKKSNCIYFLNVNSPIEQILEDYCKQEKIKTLFARIPDRIKCLLQDGVCKLVLDVTSEGPTFSESDIIAFHKLADDIGCSRKQLIFANQNHLYPNHYDDWCNRNDIQLNDRINCVNTNRPLLIFVNKYGLNQEPISELSRSALLEKRRVKKWLSMNNMPKAHRFFLFYNLLQNDLLEDGYFSFNHKLDLSAGLISSLREFFPDKNDEYIANLASNFNEKLPIYLDIEAHQFNIYKRGDFINEISKELYENSYFSIVTESDFSTGNDTIRFTEKLLKPIVGLHPFLIFGNPKSLELLHNLGFKTFDGVFFDESYDQVSDPNKRFQMILEQILHLSSLKIDELNSLYLNSLDILIHNYTHLSKSLPDLCREHVRTEFLSSNLDK